MRTSKRAKSAVAVVSMVMAVSMMLGGFNAFADGESDWLKTNQDQGPVSSEINLLKKDKEDLQPQGDDDNSGSGTAEAQDTPLGVSGFQIGYSQPPLGYSMTITYDAYTEPDDPDEIPLGYSVIVNDGDEVPEDTEVLVVVEANVNEGASPFFDVLVNDEPLDNELADEVEALFSDAAEDLDDDQAGDDDDTPSFIVRVFGSGDDSADPDAGTEDASFYNDLDPDEQAVARASAAGTLSFGEPIPFQASFIPEEDSVVSIEGMLFSPIAPMTYNGGTITVYQGNSTTSTGWTYVGQTTTPGTGSNAGLTMYTYYYRCANSGYTGTGTSTVCNCGQALATRSTAYLASNPGYTGYPPLTTSHVYNVCDVAQWSNGSATAMTINFVNATSGDTTDILTRLAAVATGRKPLSLTINGNSTTQPGSRIPLATVVNNATSSIIRSGNVNTSITLNSLDTDVNAATNVVAPTGYTKTLTLNGGSYSGNSLITVGLGGTLDGSGTAAFSANAPLTVTNNGVVSHPDMTGVGAVTMDHANAEISGKIQSNLTGQIDNGTLSGSVTCNGTINFTGGEVTSDGELISLSNANPAIDMTGGTVSAFSGNDKGKLQAWSGTIRVSGGNDINRINAQSVTITNGFTNRINTISLEGGTSTINGASPIVKLYVGGGSMNLGNTSHTDVGTVYMGREFGDINSGTSTLNVANAGINNIYGGTDQATHYTNENIININASNSNITGSVYGGSTDNGGDVGTTTITINDGIVGGNIYGGPDNTSTVGSSEVNYDGGEITNGSIHGGGIAGTVNAAVVNINSPITRTELPVGHIYGNGTGSSAGRTEINILDSVTGINIYGGSNGGSGDVDSDGTYIYVGASVQGNVYGGSSAGAGVSGTNGTYIENNSAITGDVFGGNGSGGTSASGYVYKVEVQNNGSVSGRIFGGNSSDGYIANGTVITNASGATVTNGIYGTNLSGGFTVGANGVTIDNVGDVTVANGIHGGSASGGGGTIVGGVNITNDGAVTGNIYGGSADGPTITTVTGNAGGSGRSVRIQNNHTGLVSSIYGGNQDGPFTAASGVFIDNTQAMQGNIFGGNEAGGTFTTTSTGVQVQNTANVTGNIYGASRLGTANVTGNIIIGNTAVVSASIYGGNDAGTTSITGNIHITNGSTGSVGTGIFGASRVGTFGITNGDILIDNTTLVIAGGIHGGGDDPISTVNGGGIRINNSANVTGGIFGGAKSGSLTVFDSYSSGSYSVEIVNTAGTLAGNIYGGNEDGTFVANEGVYIYNNTDIDTSGNNVIYGGSKESTSSTTISGGPYGVHIVNTPNGRVAHIYGGSEDGATTTITDGVLIENDAAVIGNIYGGGEKGPQNITGNSTNAGVSIENTGGSVGDSIYGGHAPGVTGTVDNTDVQVTDGTITNYIFGGGNGSDNEVTGSTNVVVSDDTTMSGGGGIYGGGRAGSTTGTTNVDVSVTVPNNRNIYGGGQDSEVSGDTIIKVSNTQGATPILIDNVFGGGTNTAGSHSADVGGNAYVTIDNASATINQNVYGGGEHNSIAGNTDVQVLAGTVTVDVFGGGVSVGNSAVVEGNTSVLVDGALVIQNVYGGGNGNTNDVNTVGGTKTEVEIRTGRVQGHTYGGGFNSNADNTNVAVTAIVEKNVYGGGSSTTTAGASVTTTNILIDTGAVIGLNTTDGNVFGGGTSSTTNNPVATVTDKTYIEIRDGQIGNGSATDRTATVYGGGEYNPVANSTEILMTGGTVDRDVFGGGLGINAPVNTSAGDTTAVSKVTINGGVVNGGTNGGNYGTARANSGHNVGGVYGGGYDQATINGATEVLIDGGIVNTNVYGGGLQNANVTGNTYVTVNSGTVSTNVYGGGRLNSDVKGAAGSNVTIKGGVVTHSVYGGGLDNAKVDTDARVTIEGSTTVGSAPLDIDNTNNGDVVFGGGTGQQNSTIGRNTFVTIQSGATVNAAVHGGGDGGDNSSAQANHVRALGAGITTVEIANINTKVTGNVFGGGHDTEVNETHVTVRDSAEVDGTIWGGGVSRATANASVLVSGTMVTVDNSTVTGDVHGGGIAVAANNANVNPDANVTIQNGSKVYGSVYGGGESINTLGGPAEIAQDTNVKVDSSQVHTDLWGGGHSNEDNTVTVRRNVDIYITSGIIGATSGNVYGGGLKSPIDGVVNILTDGNTVIHGRLHGGGWGQAAIINSSSAVEDDVITIVLEGNTNVKDNVYGGGEYGDVFGSIKLQVLSKLFEGNIYGGGHNANVQWNTDVYVSKNATVNKSVYGGGIKDDTASAPSNQYVTGGHTNVLIDGHILEDVFGGGHWSDVDDITDTGSTKVRIRGHVDGDVYGGGRDANVTNATDRTEVYITGGHPDALDGVAIVGKDDGAGNISGGNVYGGGWNENSGVVDGYGNINSTGGTYVELQGNNENTKAWVKMNVYGGGRNFGSIMDTTTGGGTVVELMNYSEVGIWRDTRTVIGQGDVFGGGNYGHVHGPAGTQVTLWELGEVHGTIYGGSYYADVTHADSGTEVYIYGKVGDRYHVPDTDPINNDENNGAYPSYYNHTGNVYGGGHHGNIDGNRGTYLIVTDRSGNNNALVHNDVFGGGFEGDVKFDTVVVINDGSEIYRSVFGGGQQQSPSNPGPAHVYGTTNVTIEDARTKVGRADITRLGKNTDRPNGIGDQLADEHMLAKVEQENLEYHAGRIFGGGDFATVGGTANVTVDNLAQIAYRTISGGSFGVHSVNTDRNITLRTLGTGEGLANVYDDLSYYTVIKHLQDYTLAEVHDSYLTVYYHLRSVDDGSYNGLPYTPDYNAEYQTFGGKYHPWRPYPHKDIIVEPNLRFDNTFFRMEGGYTIDMRRGSIMSVTPDPVELLIDRFDVNNGIIPPRVHEDRLTATSKLYGPDDNIVSQGVFAYSYLPVTAFPTDLNDRTSFAINGINMYIPPTDVRSVKGNSTNHGGSTDTDWTTGNHGAPQLEATDRTVSVRATQASQQELLNKVQAAVQKTAVGKTAYVSESRYDTITGGILSALGKAAARENSKMILMADTMNGNSVQGRLYLDPNLFASDKTLNLRVYTTADQIAQTKVNFQQYYKNEFAFVKLGQTDPFGTEVEIAAKVSLGNLDTENLIFYAYSESTNSYRRIENPRYFIDKNGYLHFHTAVGGTMVITDTPLARK